VLHPQQEAARASVAIGNKCDAKAQLQQNRLPDLPAHKGRETEAVSSEIAFETWKTFTSPLDRRQTKFLTCEVACFTPSAHAQSDIPGHGFRYMLRTDD